MNYLIALVEDSHRDRENVISYFTRLAGETGDHYDLKSFHTGGEFISAYQPMYDMVLMDIQMPGLSGMEAAHLLRKLDEKVILLFITSLAQYALEGYEVAATDFLVKPVEYPAFRRKIIRALSLVSHDSEEEIILSLRDGVQYRLSPSRIRYIEIQSHNLLIHTPEGVLESYGSLNELETRLTPGQFIRCHRSYLVNLAHVKAVHGLNVMVGNEELPLAKLKRQDFMQALNRYLGGSV